jgi:hypothetical protein
MLLSELLAPIGGAVPSATVTMILQIVADAVRAVICIMSVSVALRTMILHSDVRRAICIMRPVHASQIMALFQLFVLSAGAAICLQLDASAAHVIAHIMFPVHVYWFAFPVSIKCSLALHSIEDLSTLLITAHPRMNVHSAEQCSLKARHNM